MHQNYELIWLCLLLGSSSRFSQIIGMFQHSVKHVLAVTLLVSVVAIVVQASPPHVEVDKHALGEQRQLLRRDYETYPNVRNNRRPSSRSRGPVAHRPQGTVKG